MSRSALFACLLAPALAHAEDAGRRYALLVGVQNYTGTELGNLRHAENDVAALAAVFRDDGYKLVTLMTDAEGFVRKDKTLFPTAENIRTRLAALLRDRKPSDTVVVAFAGHGVVLKGTTELQFCPLQADLARPKETLVPLGDVYAAMKDCKAGVKLLIVDACRNEASATRSREVANLESASRPAVPKPPEGVAALFSCSAGELAFESRKHPHGVFFHHLLEGVRGAAANKRGEVTLERLTAHVKDEMADTILAEFGPNVRQQPHLMGELAGSAPLVRSRPGSDLARRGKEELDRHDYDAAIATLSQAIAADGTEPLRRAYRADALVMRYRNKEAIADADVAVKHGGDLAVPHIARARALERGGQPNDALRECDAAVRLDSRSAIALAVRAEVLARLKRFDEAMAEADKALVIDPQRAFVYCYRGVVSDAKGDFDRAVADCTEAIRLDPKFALAFSNRGSIYHKQGDFDRAVADYTEAIRLDPKNAHVYCIRGYAYRKKGDFDRAIADYTEAIRLDPKNVFAFHNRGLAYDEKREYDRAIADYTEAIRLDPKNASVFYNRGWAYDEKREYDRAVADYTEAIRLDPKDAHAFNNRGYAYRQKGDIDRAIADYTEAIRLDPKYANAYRNRGYAYQLRGDQARANADSAIYKQLTGKDP